MYSNYDYEVKEKIEEEISSAIIEKNHEKVKFYIKQGYIKDAKKYLKSVMISNDFEMIKLLKEMGYQFKNDHKCIEEYMRYGSGLEEVLMYLLNNGATVSWKALEITVNHSNLPALNLLMDRKKDFFPVG